MWVLVAIAVGGELFGVIGMFLMIPFAAVIQTLIRECISGKLHEKKISPDKLTPQPPLSRDSLKVEVDEVYDAPEAENESQDSQTNE